MKQKDLTRGPILKQFVSYLIPTMLGTLSVSTFAFVDMLFVGKGVGSDGLAVLSLALPFVIVGGAVSLLLGIGGCTILGIEMGRKNTRAQTEIFSVCMTVGLIIGGLITVFGLLFLDPITHFLGASEELFDGVKQYLIPLTATQMLYIANQIIGFFIRVDGDPRTVMYATIASNGFNILFDYILVMVVHWGVFGASLATGLAPGVGLLVNCSHFWRKKNKIHLRPSRAMFRWLPRVCKNGFGSCVSEVASSFSIFCYNSILLKIPGGGALAVAAYSVISNIDFISFSLANSIGQSAQPMVGVNCGAGNTARVKKAIKITYLFAGAFGLLLFGVFELIPSQVIGAFAKAGETGLIAIGTHGLRLYSFAFITMAVNLATIALLQAMECSGSANLLSVCKGVIFMLASLFTLPFALGLDGVWLAKPVSELATLVLCAVLLVRVLPGRLLQVEQAGLQPPSEKQQRDTGKA